MQCLDSKSYSLEVEKSAKEITKPVFSGWSKEVTEGENGWRMTDHKGQSNRQVVKDQCRVQLY
ncbi:hypothetical protein CAEBREN_23728 [Caenorhabditis brenneri]|uniref:Uncharacterized protein n=1 Tax=Caenorhabditis brenneri TaxID=135651 RepID=G0NBH5_CAEBE|nr:hypothetical protein CAEBREN_23728 [Caenorhabditis brenneri]